MIMDDCKSLFYFSKFPKASERIYPKMINSLGNHPQKVCPL
jgi:hypothetical protein